MAGEASSKPPYAVVRDAEDERVRAGWKLVGPGLRSKRFGFDESRERLDDLAALLNDAFAHGVAAAQARAAAAEKQPAKG